MKSLNTFVFLLLTFSSIGQISSDRYLKNGIEDFKSGYYLSAMEYLNKAIDLDSSNSDAYYYRGLTYKCGYKADFYPQTIKDFAACIKIDSTQHYWEAYLYLARAMSFYDKSFQNKYPNIELVDTDVHKTAHQYFIKAFALEPSIELAEKIVRIYSPNLDYYSTEFIDFAIKKYPSNYVLLKYKARSLMNTYKYDRAIRAYKELIKINKKDGELYNDVLICMSRKRSVKNQEIDMKFYCKMIQKANKYYRKEQNYEYCEEC